MKPVPETVPVEHKAMYAAVNTIRGALKADALFFQELRALALKTGNGEAIANVVLAYRHVEDASMRLGKALQALDGGVSVYDRDTTVGG